MRNACVFLLSITITACSTGPAPVSSPYYRIPMGSKLILKQTLTIPPNAGRVYIQYGKVVTAKEKDDFYPHCWFLSWKVLSTAQVIKPDTFTITKSEKREDMVSRRSVQRFAMNGLLAMGMYSDGGPMALVYSTQMHIHSDRQPNIRRFACSYWENPDDAKHLTVAEMQKTLGKIAQIQLNTNR